MTLSVTKLRFLETIETRRTHWPWIEIYLPLLHEVEEVMTARHDRVHIGYVRWGFLKSGGLQSLGMLQWASIAYKFRKLKGDSMRLSRSWVSQRDCASRTS